MGITERFFQFGSELNVIHLPYRPNGFCIFILGDRTHFVSRDSSFWLEHEGRNQLLHVLDRGYTIFNSNLYGRHWGSEKAVLYARQLMHYVLKQETSIRKYTCSQKAWAPLSPINCRSLQRSISVQPQC